MIDATIREALITFAGAFAGGFAAGLVPVRRRTHAIALDAARLAVSEHERACAVRGAMIEGEPITEGDGG